MSDLDLYLQNNNLDSEIDDFLEHFGVKGQRWGILNKRVGGAFSRRKGNWKTRSKGQKLGIVVGGWLGGSVASAAVSAITNKVFKRNIPIANLASFGGGAILGGRFTRNVLQKNGKKPMKQLIKKPQRFTNEEAIQRTQTFLDKHPSGRM